MKGSTLKQLLADLIVIQDKEDVLIAGLSLDSRTVKPGDLFFSCDGRSDSTRLQPPNKEFIEDAIENGAVAVIHDTKEKASYHLQSANNKKIPIIALPNLAEQMAKIADRFFNHPTNKFRLIGITGTNGKTSCSHFIAACLEMAQKKSGIIGTLGNGMYGDLHDTTHTTPNLIELFKLFADMAKQKVEYIAMEVSSHGLEQKRVAGLSFEIAVFTNLTRDHLDFHGSMENYANAKRKLFLTPHLRYAVINSDDEFGRQLIQEFSSKLKIYGYSVDGNVINENLPQIRVQHAKFDMNGIVASIHTPWGDGVLRSRLLGRFNLSNLLAVLTTLCIIGVPLEASLDYLSRLHGVAGRMELFGGGDKPLVVVDYAHTPDALQKLLISAREFCQGQLWCVFGCGGDRDKGKRPEMGAMVEKHADQFVITDDNPRHENPVAIVADILRGLQLPEAAVIEHNRERAIAHAINCAKVGDIILVAGKGHENYQQIGDEKRPFNDALTVQMILAEQQL